MIKISCIIPCFNHQEYVATAIASALDQTIPCEIIFVNDGSTDNSLEIAKSFQNKGVRIVNQVNKGLPSARNTGIMNATGDYILPLDADDMLKENCIERLTQIIKETDGDIIAPSFKCFGIENREIILDPRITVKDFVTGNRIGYFSAIRRTKLLECGGYSPRMTWGYEDYHLWFDLMSRGIKMVILSDVLVMYRTKTESMLAEANKHQEELMAQIQKDFPFYFI